ncbi:MAG TPA: chemotaxis protein CheW [Terriglobales bacterium]|nr:chemotaxis protein CheW [Terriglobales bacterium]
MRDSEHYLLFRLDSHRFAIEVGATERIIHAVEVTPLEGVPEVVLGIINVHGSIVPVYDLRRRFGIPAREIDITDQFLLARANQRTVALVTDAVLGVVQCPEGEDQAGRSGNRSALPLEDGPVPIHQLEQFLSADEEARLSAALAAMSATGTGAAARS